MNESDVERRARRLVALYPGGWRARFGDEFEQLLIDEMHDIPRSWRRSGDVGAHALWAWLGEAGLVGRGGTPQLRAWIALRGLAVASAVFGVVGVGMWSQLTVGWQWSAPSGSATRAGMLMMSAALAGLGVVILLALLPVGWSVFGAVRRRQLGSGLWSLTASVAAGVAFWLGCRHLGSGWPGTGGHPWSGRGLVPGGSARIAWAGTVWMSAYWAHPGALRGFPAGELAWMAVSPLLLAACLGCALHGVRDLVLSASLLRWLAILGCAGVALAAVFLAGAVSWVVSGSPGPHRLFEVGVIDDLGLVLLASALGAGSHTARRAIAATAPAVRRASR